MVQLAEWSLSISEIPTSPTSYVSESILMNLFSDQCKPDVKKHHNDFRHRDLRRAQDRRQGLQHHVLALLQRPVVGAQTQPLHGVLRHRERHRRGAARAR